MNDTTYESRQLPVSGTLMPSNTNQVDAAQWTQVQCKPYRKRKKESILKLPNLLKEYVQNDGQDFNEDIPITSKQMPRYRKKDMKLANLQRQSIDDSHVQTFISVDSLISLIVGLAHAENNVTAFSLINLYMNAEFKAVKTGVLSALIECIIGDKVERQSVGSDFVMSWKNAIADWKTALKSPIFPILSRLLSAIVSLGICNKTDIEFSIGRFRVFEINAREKHMSAASIVDALLDTVTFFIDGAWACIQYGSLKPLMCASPEHFQMINDITDISARMDSYTSGNLYEQYNITEKDFAISIDNMLVDVENFLRTSDDKYEKAVLMKYFERLKTFQIRAKVHSNRGGLQKSPFTFAVSHKSGVGKSTVAELFATAALVTLGETPDPARMVYDNATEKYDSNYMSNMQILYIDDMSNSRPDKTEGNPTNAVIRIGNNVPARATMAALEDKGKVVISPTILAVTSNWDDLNARAFSSHPATILRRFIFFVEVNVRPEFQKNGSKQLDTQKVIDHYGCVPEYPDVWLFTFTECLPVERETSCVAATLRRVLQNKEGVPMRDVDLFVGLDFVKDTARVHSKKQQMIVDASKKRFDMQLCQACDKFCCICAFDDPSVDTEILERHAHDDGQSFGDTEEWLRTPDEDDHEGNDEKEEDMEEDDEELTIVSTASAPLDPHDLVTDRPLSPIIEDTWVEDFENEERITTAPHDVGPEGRVVVDGVVTNITHAFPNDNNHIVRTVGNLGNETSYHHRTEDFTIREIGGRIMMFPNIQRQGMLGEYFAKTMVSVLTSQSKRIYEEFSSRSFVVERTATDVLLEKFKKYENSSLMRITNLIPDSWMRTPLCKQLCLAFSAPEIETYVRRRIKVLLLSAAGLAVFTCRRNPYKYVALSGLIGTFLPTQYVCRLASEYIDHSLPCVDFMSESVPSLSVAVVAASVYCAAAQRLSLRNNLSVLCATAPMVSMMLSSSQIRKKAIEREWDKILSDRASPRNVMLTISEKKKKIIMACLGGAAIVGATLTAIKGVQKVLERQSLLMPETKEEVAKRNDHKPIWRRVVCNTVPCSKASSTATHDQLLEVVSKSIVSFAVSRIENGVEHTQRCCGLPISKSYVMMPAHAFYDSNDKIIDRGAISYLLGEVDTAGSGSTKVFVKDQIVKIDGFDLAIVHMPFLGPRRDLLKFLPDIFTQGSVRSVARRPIHGNIHVASTTLSLMDGGFSTSSYTFDIRAMIGWSDKKPMVGDCGAVYVSLNKPIQIVGMHVAGSNASTTDKRVVACPLTRATIKAAIAELETRAVTLPTCNSGSMDLNQSLTPITIGPVHRKSPVCYDQIETQTAYVVYGCVPDRSTFRSDVMKSRYSDDITSIFGVERQHGRPQTKYAWTPWRVNFEKRTAGGLSFPLDLLERSAKDYVHPIEELIEGNRCECKLGVLTLDEAVNGLPGERFIDSLDMSKAIGYPRIGKKSKFFSRGDPCGMWTDYIMLDDATKYDVDRILSAYDSGEASHVIIKSCLKDEPTRFGKDKIRVFESSPSGFTIVIRILFSRLIAFLQFNPLIAELAVGIDCTSPEWDELEKWLSTYPSIFAGDYKAWDQSLPSELILKAVDCLMRIAKASGMYTPQDIQRMRCAASDIAFATLQFDGTIFQIMNSHISGNGLTVIINCICNSLALRSFYFTRYDAPFRTHINMITYGDDNKGCVSDEVPEFNMIEYAKWIGDVGLQFTMPDKISTMIPYFKRSEDVDFLKRKTVFHPKLDCRLGALDEGSIFKSLHCYRKSSKLAQEAYMIAVLRGALNEWFIHGEKIYEERRSQVIEFSEKVLLDVPGSEKDYNSLCDEWLDRFKTS